MFSDVVELRDFYQSRLGEAADHALRRQVRDVWPDLTGQRLLGLGYALPLLREYGGEAERTLAFMPSQQGVLRWPPEQRNAAALVDEGALPLPDYAMDRVVLVHSLEHTEQLRTMLEEAWRVLLGDGRLLVIVPNRRGVWARLERTPFSQGRPYSAGQLSRLLRGQKFLPMRTEHCLFFPPSHARTLLAAAPAWERIGHRWFTGFGGVVMIEAVKQQYALTKQIQPRRLRARVAAPFPNAVRPPAYAARSGGTEVGGPGSGARVGRGGVKTG